MSRRIPIAFACCALFVLGGVPGASAKNKGNLTVLSVGKSPRTKLRIRVKKGHTETLTTTTRMTMQATGLQFNQTIPPMLMRVAVKVTGIRPNGDIEYDSVVLASHVVKGSASSQQIATVLNQVMAKVRGTLGSSVMSSRGILLKMKYAIPKNASAQMRKMLQDMERGIQSVGIALPIRPIGVGARWTYTNPLNMGMLNLIQTSTYELLSIKGDRIRLRLQLTQTTNKQQSGNPIGGVVIESMVSRGTGTMDLSLRQISPVLSVVTMKGSMTMSVGNGRKIKMLTNTVLHVSAK